MNVLVINCGSSSLKYQVINSETEDVLAKGLCERIGIDGRLVYELPALEEIRSYVKKQLECEIWKEEQRFENAHPHYLDMSPAMFELKMGLLHESSASDNA